MKEAKQEAGSDFARIYYDAWNRRDWEWIGAMLSSDVEWNNTARDERIKGVTAVLSSFRSVVEGFPSAIIDIRAVHNCSGREQAGSTIIVECGIRVGRETTSVRTATFCEVLEIKNGRCVRGTTYADSVRLLMDMSTSSVAAA